MDVRGRSFDDIILSNQPYSWYADVSKATYHLMVESSFDIIIIGSGPAGTAAAEAAKDAGTGSLCIVEAAERLGGECPNWGCVPTKAMLRSAEVYETVKHADEFGIKVSDVKFDFSAIMERKQRIVDAMTGGGRLEGYFDKELGATLLRGKARFVDKNIIEVDGKRYKGRKFVVATGSSAWVPPIDGIEEAGHWTSDDIVTLKDLPESIIIVGGGPIGVESAQILGTFGVDVTIVEFASHILPREDTDIAEVVEASFRGRGIRILAGSGAKSVRKEKDMYHVTVATGDEETGLKARAFMVAAGKRPSLDGLDLDVAGIDVTDRGAPILDDRLRSTNRDVYFAGDAAGPMMFTHVAHEQGVIAAENALKGDLTALDLRVVPRGTFCDPEVGSVGMTEKEARDADHDVGVGKFPYAYVGKSAVSGYREGMVKIVVDKETKMVLGGHIVGHGASELIHELALAIYAEIPYTKIAGMIHAYPTFAEALGAAVYGIV